MIKCFQVEAAYDMLLMQSLSQRRSGKVVNSSIRYADVKPVSSPRMMGMGSMPQWLQSTVKSRPVSVEAPAVTSELGIQAGVYGALMVLTYVNGASTTSGSYGGADVPGLILATSFGASLYFMTKRNVKLGKWEMVSIVILFTNLCFTFYRRCLCFYYMSSTNFKKKHKLFNVINGQEQNLFSIVTFVKLIMSQKGNATLNLGWRNIVYKSCKKKCVFPSIKVVSRH